MTFKDYRDIIRQMERDMAHLSDDMFRGFFNTPVGSGRFWYPPVDIHETAEALQVKVELAGVKPEELNVSLAPDDRILTISGMRKEPPGEHRDRLRCHQLEIYFGPFERAIALPPSIQVRRDDITANYRDGFLLVTLPKKPAQVLEKHSISISMGEEIAPKEAEASIHD